MGNLYRFVEPVALFLLKRKPRSYGYELANDLRPYALTDAKIEVAALYKTLRQLEENGCATSEWDVEGGGPARRVYALTARGEEHLEEWITVLDHMCKSMKRLTKEARAALARDAGVP
jgi:DNA-binding PadR family transcriptional regulator